MFTVGGARPRQEGPSFVRKVAEQANQQLSSMGSASVSASRFPSRLPLMLNCKL